MVSQFDALSVLTISTTTTFEDITDRTYTSFLCMMLIHAAERSGRRPGCQR